MDENKIKQLMKSLELTREEAIELIQEDMEIDKMSMKEVDNDLTPEQKQAVKKAKNGARAVDAYGKKHIVQRKADEDKRTLISMLYSTLHSADDPVIENIEVTNPERQIDFNMNGRRFRIVLSAPRK